jgi:hypothetical protein
MLKRHQIAPYFPPGEIHISQIFNRPFRGKSIGTDIYASGDRPRTFPLLRRQLRFEEDINSVTRGVEAVGREKT